MRHIRNNKRDDYLHFRKNAFLEEAGQNLPQRGYMQKRAQEKVDFSLLESWCRLLCQNAMLCHTAWGLSHRSPSPSSPSPSPWRWRWLWSQCTWWCSEAVCRLQEESPNCSQLNPAEHPPSCSALYLRKITEQHLVLNENGALLQWASPISKFGWNRAKRCLGTNIWSCQKNKRSCYTIFAKHNQAYTPNATPYQSLRWNSAKWYLLRKSSEERGWLAKVVNLVREGAPQKWSAERNILQHFRDLIYIGTENNS